MKLSLTTHKISIGEVTYISLRAENGIRVVLSSLGAGIVEIDAPDAEGHIDNITLGYESPESYLHDGPCMGKTPGRYANRIGRGDLKVGRKSYQLAINCGPHHLHGGPEGFQNHIWDYRIEGDSVTFHRTSPDGEEGYPATLEAYVTYTLTADGVLSIDYRATSDAPTVCNLTNHTYWNLDGEGSGCALGHSLKILATHFLETDTDLCPTGEFTPVKDTPMDFSSHKEVGRDIKEEYLPLQIGKGYDHCFCARHYDGKGSLVPVAELRAAHSGRVLQVLSTMPGMQLYTANWLTGGTPRSISGHDYHDYDAVALECQMFPDSPHHSHFPTTEVTPDSPYHQQIVFRISAEKLSE